MRQPDKNDMIIGGVYKPDPVSDQPEVVIVQWAVKELSNKDRHLVGVIPASGHDGRVTSKIMSYSGHTIITRSRRKYYLRGSTGYSLNSEYVWKMWCLRNNIDPAITVDVSDEYAGFEQNS